VPIVDKKQKFPSNLMVNDQYIAEIATENASQQGTKRK
jgi:hypothetical protein